MTRICWGHTANCFIYDFVSLAIGEKNKDFMCYLRDIFKRKYFNWITLIPIDLVTNWLLSLFCSFVSTKTKINFSRSWWAGNEKYFCFLHIPSRAILQRHAKFNSFLIKKFCCMSFLFVYSSMVKVSLSKNKLGRFWK